jgi:hypothetical protein
VACPLGSAAFAGDFRLLKHPHSRRSIENSALFNLGSLDRPLRAVTEANAARIALSPLGAVL